MKSLQSYLAEREKTYSFCLKMCIEPTEDQLNAMERYLTRFDVFDVETPTRTIFHTNPHGFPHIEAGEVYIINFKTKLPATPPMLRDGFVAAMQVAERNIRVYNEDEPLAKDFVEDDSEYNVRVTDDTYSEYENPNADDYYGEKFKLNFIDELVKNRQPTDKEYKND